MALPHGLASGFVWFGLAGRNGFVSQFQPRGPEPFQILDGTAVEAFGLGLIAQ